MFNQGPQNVAMLLEGNFTSSYQFRLPPEITEDKSLEFHPQSIKPGKMIIVGDGDIAKNQFRAKDGQILPLGYDQWTGQTYGNKDFLLNVVNYLTDDSGLITVRSRELKLRQLDPMKISGQRVTWQIINVLVPVLLLIIFALVRFRIRKNKYLPKEIKKPIT
jgi:ABC-2 type transport system permease protein